MKTFIMVIYVMFSESHALKNTMYTPHYKFPTIESCQLFSDMLTNELSRFDTDVKIYCQELKGTGL